MFGKIFYNGVLLVVISGNHLVSNEAGAENGRFKLGVIIPMSGDLAFFGKGHTVAANLFEEDFPSIERNFDVVYEDSSYDSRKAVLAYTKLKAVDKVDAIFSFGGPMLASLAPVAEADKMPFFAPESEPRDVAGRKYVSLFRNVTAEFGKVFWSEARNRGFKKIGIVRNINQFMDTFVRGLTEASNPADGEQVETAIEVAPGTVDLRSEVLRVKGQKFDALGIFLLPGSHRAFLMQAKTLAMKSPMFGVEEFFEPHENQDLAEFIEGTVVIAPNVSERFRTRYREKYKSDVSVEYGGEYYDFLVLLNETLARRDSKPSRDEFLADMRFAGEKSGQAGKYVVKETADRAVYYSFPIAIYAVKAGKPELLRVVERP